MEGFSYENSQFEGVLKLYVKSLRHFPGYKSIMKKVDNMKTILTCVSALKDVKLEDRHWKDLEELVEKEISYKDATFNFGSLVDLELHKKSDAVNELAEIAKKEEKYEKQLIDIKKEWEDRRSCLHLEAGS